MKHEVIVMKKSLIVLTTLLVLGMLSTGSALADRGPGGGRGGPGPGPGGGGWHGGHGGHGYGGPRVGIGVSFGSPFWSPWYYPPPYYPAYYPPAVPVVIERQAPPVYIEQPQPAQVQAQAGYWYYCRSPSGYYPEVRECNTSWIQVPPRP